MAYTIGKKYIYAKMPLGDCTDCHQINRPDDVINARHHKVTQTARIFNMAAETRKLLKNITLRPHTMAAITTTSAGCRKNWGRLYAGAIIAAA